MISEPLVVHTAGLLQQQFYLLVGEDLRELPLHLFRFHALGWVFRTPPLLLKPAVEALQGGQGTGDGGRRLPHLEQLFSICLDALTGSAQHLPVFPQVVDILGDVPHIGGDRIGGSALLCHKIGFELGQQIHS